MEKDQFIETILNSANGISRVRPDESLFERIEQKIRSSQVPTRTIWWVAASIAVLIALNITAVSSGKKTTENQTTTAFASTLDPSSQLY